MQTASSRFWTPAVVSISYKGNHYAIDTSPLDKLHIYSQLLTENCFRNKDRKEVAGNKVINFTSYLIKRNDIQKLIYRTPTFSNKRKKTSCILNNITQWDIRSKWLLETIWMLQKLACSIFIHMHLFTWYNNLHIYIYIYIYILFSNNNVLLVDQQGQNK